MKRFALKRITALVLALVMTLSLLPMNAWATEGEPEYQKLYMNKGHDTEENANYVETHRLDVGSSEYLWLFVDENGVKTGVTGDYTPNVVGTNGSIGTLTFEDGQGKGFKWDTTGATASEGFLEVSKAGSPVYRMPVTVNLNPGGGGDQPSDVNAPVFNSDGDRIFGQAGVFVFSGIDPENRILFCGNDVQGSPNGITVNCAGQGRKTVFLAANKYDTISVSDATLSHVDGVWYDREMACNIYELTVSKPETSSVVEYTVTRSWKWHENGEEKTNSQSFTLVFDFSPVFTGNFACGQAGVFFFSLLDEANNELIRGDAIMGEPGKVTVACAGQESKTIFLTANKHDVLSVSNASLSNVDGIWYDETPDGRWPCNIYALTVNKPETDSVVEYTVTRTSTWYENNQPVSRSENFPVVFDFNLQPGNWGGDQGGGEDTTYWKTYNTKYAGNSTFTVRRTELQAQVLTLPDEINENNELIITVHNAAENNEAVWRELVQRDELMVSYFFDSIEDEDVKKPMVKSLGTNGSIAEALAWLAEYPFVDYNFPSGRFNGLDFAWASAEIDRTVVIPTEGLMVSSWIWGYDSGDDTYTEKPDGVIVKLVLDNDISNAIVLEEEKHPAVEAERVSLIGHDGLDIGDEKIFSGSYEEASGVFSYQYIGNATAEQGFVSAAINTDVLAKIDRYRPEQTDEPIYQLLKVTAPTGYTAKYFSSRFFEGSVEGNEIILEYLWRGLGTEQTYTLVWCKGEGESYREYVEQITVAVPTVAGVETWMDHINGSKSEYTNCATAVADANVLIKQAGKAESGAEISYSNGVVWTDFVQGEMLNVEAIEEATISIKIPDGAVAYKLARPGDGADDPTYNENNKWAPDDFQSILEACEYVALIGNEEYIDGLSVNALKEQNIGDIQYYYSADRGTWLILIKWIFDSENEDNGAKYEWIRLDAENYFCQWEEELMKDSEVTDEVNVPTATTDGLADSDIKLIARIHPQKQEDGYGQYFFELEMVAEGQGNVYTDTEGTTYFTIILPYSFMGDDWDYEKAKNLKEKPMITHFDKEYKKLAGDKGTITGEYTERGIEFKVNSFSPFTVSWDETIKDNTGGTPGGYYPVVPPTTPVEKPTETKPTTPAQPVAPPAEVTVPVSGDENTINVEASVSGTTATIDKVDMTKLEGVIGDDVAVGTVTIDFSDLESSEVIDTVEIPADVVKEIAEAVADPNNDAESLEIVLSDGASIEFDAAALAEKVSQAGGADITISIKQAVENVLSAAQQAAVGDRVAFDINVTSGGVHISDMGGKITIHAPYELRDGETAEGIVVYYVDDEGNKEKCETSYDSVKKRVNWKTDHLSVYMLAHDAPATDDAPAVDNAPADDATQNDSGNSVGLWIGVVLVVLVAAIVVLMILIKRKKA